MASKQPILFVPDLPLNPTAKELRIFERILKKIAQPNVKIIWTGDFLEKYPTKEEPKS